jgi:hypothetical protein
MREIPVSKFKATCLALVDEVGRTREPIRITKFGKVVAELGPPKKHGRKKKSWLGCLKDQTEIIRDLTDMSGAWGEWGR